MSVSIVFKCFLNIEPQRVLELGEKLKFLATVFPTTILIYLDPFIDSVSHADCVFLRTMPARASG